MIIWLKFDQPESARH